jgi:general secretion pathway protein D
MFKILAIPTFRDNGIYDRCSWGYMLLASLLSLSVSPLGYSQEPPATAKSSETMVQLNFPEQMDLKLLIEYVSTRLDVKILYDEAIANKKLTIKAPGQIPTDSLMELLESALKMKGLALVDADVPNWKQIVESRDLVKIAEPSQPGQPQETSGTLAVTQAFTLRHIKPQQLSQLIKPFLTEPGGNTITIDEQNLLIITDYAKNLQRIAELVQTIDQAGPPSVLRFYEVKHVESASLAQQITQLLAARAKTQGRESLAESRFDVTHDERTNQLVIVGPQTLVEQVLQLVKTLDVPLGLRTEVYSFRYVAAERIDSLIKELFDPLTIKRLYRSAIDTEDNLLIVTAPDSVHERVNWLRDEMDIEGKRPASSVKFYKLRNASAEEVLQTLMSIQQTGNYNFEAYTQVSHIRGVSPLGRGPTGAAGYSMGEPASSQFVPGANYPSTPAQPDPTLPPAFVPEAPPGAANAQPTAPGELPFLPESARITADPFTNSIIVVGDRSAQEVYKDLIEYLDRKRPQVLIEARVVIIDTSNDYSLGIELSGGDREGVDRLFQFTSYGLSTVNPTTGALALIPGRGLNGTLIDADDADAVLRALSTHRKAKVISSPRVLVNDNATGTLASVTEVPFTSVNASNTVATTSFAGFAEAGTTIEVSPRISEDDHLVLDYVVTLNSFTGSGGAGVPPPRQTDEVRSTVTIPDGSTVIVGGLNRYNTSWNYDGIPFIEHIPVVRTLTGVTDTSNSRTTLFVFLKPVILRDDKFRDLRYISDKDLNCAGCKQNYPSSQPMLVK